MIKQVINEKRFEYAEGEDDSTRMSCFYEDIL
jgi:hypothetical protein